MERGNEAVNKSWWIKVWLLIALTLGAVAYVYPTLSRRDAKELASSKLPFKKKMNMGLDLQGGVYMVLGIDFTKVFRDNIERQVAGFIQDQKQNAVTLGLTSSPDKGSLNTDDPIWNIEFTKGKRAEVEAILANPNWSETLTVVQKTETSLSVNLARVYRADIKDKTLTQSIEVIRNRIDEFGVSEPVITSQGTDRVVVELPGLKDVERAKELIGKTARLEFRVVNDKAISPASLMGLVSKIEEDNKISYKEGETKLSEYTRLINEKASSQIPEDSEILFERIDFQSKLSQNPDSSNNAQTSVMPLLIHKAVDVSGDDLQDASVGFNPETQRPEVFLRFNPPGANKFDKVTGDHVGERLAIVLDAVVHSAPVLKQRISEGRASISLGGGNADLAMREAKDLATVLRAGALPAQLNFLEQRVVGPSLGGDSVAQGAFAAIIGSVLVLVFIVLWYRVSGIIAAVSLVMNVLFVMACLVGLDATLTLPGIAGIALTVGIAVDSNVVIYERIREELANGKGISAAIDGGFDKAFRTIFDANVTNAAAAIVLLVYGTGPIKGFAVTMLIGIVTTLFSAVFICRVMFEAYLHRLRQAGSKALSI